MDEEEEEEAAMDSCSTGSSTGSNFRELDVEFLQTQAKIWIEQVLEKRFDDEETVVDLLADGEILFKVSKIISELMRRRFGAKIDSPDTFPEATAFAKHGGKYLPYSNVDAFLKVCQKLGLTGIDLFSPPDVVEKKDIRRVCLCIRALSKKARSRHLDVPDFDVVTHGFFMPTDMVDSIRKYLEKTSYTVSGKSEYSPGPGLKGKLGNNNEPFFTGRLELSPEDPDEAESKLKSPDSGSPGSLLEGNAGLTTDIYSTSPRSPNFKSEDWSSQSSTTSASPIRNSLAELNIPLTPKNIDEKSSNEECRIMQTFITDAGNEYTVKPDPSSSNEHFSDSIHEELINTSVVSNSPVNSSAHKGENVDVEHVDKYENIGPLPVTNLTTQINDASALVLADLPLKDKHVNGNFSDSPKLTDTGIEDIVNEFMGNSVLCISDRTCEERADPTSVSVCHGFEEAGKNDVVVGCPTTISELDRLDVGSKNPLKLGCVDADSTDTLQEDSVDIDRIIVSDVNDDDYYMNEPKTGSVDIDFVNQPKSDFVDTDSGDMPEADIFHMASANVPKIDSVDINCANVPEEDSVVNAMNGLEPDSVDVDITNVLKPETVDVHGCPNSKKADGIKLGRANSPEADGVEVDTSDVTKGDSMDTDYLYIRQSETPDADHALIADESINRLLQLEADSGHVHNEENQSEIEKIIPRKDESVENMTTFKHNRIRLWMPFLAGGLAALGTMITIMQASSRKPKDFEVKKGDTLSQISKRVGKSSWKELVQLNPEINNPDLIYPGDRLKLK